MQLFYMNYDVKAVVSVSLILWKSLLNKVKREFHTCISTLLDGQDLFGYKGHAFSDDPQGKKQLCLLDSTTGKERWCVDRLQPSLFSRSTTQDMVIAEETLQPGVW